MISLIKHMLHNALENPLVFDLQQRVCNNYEAVRNEFGGTLNHLNGEFVLDVGCSTGACARSIVDISKCNYVGVDIEEHYIKIAKKRSPAASFYAMDARKMSFPEDSFDLAMFIGVMHHMDDDLVKSCLKEVSRVLRKNGRVIIAEPVFTPGRHFSNLLLSMDRGRNIRDETGYSALFGRFTIVRQNYFDFSIHRFCSFELVPANV